MNIILVRHGETEENVSRIVQGQRPGKLTPHGQQQVKQLAIDLKNEDIAAIYTSDLSRCVKTAEALHKYHKKIPLILRTELREFSFGVFEGVRVRGGASHFTVRYAVRLGQILPLRLVGIDSPKRVRQRIIPFLNRIYTKHKKDTIVIVSHGGPIRIIRSEFENVPFRKLLHEHIPNSSVWRLTMNSPL